MTGSVCATGARTASGKLCPEIEHAPVTAEGFHVARAMKRAASWEGGGFSRLRLDRNQILRRFPADLDVEAAEDMLDVAENAALKALADRPKPPPKGAAPK